MIGDVAAAVDGHGRNGVWFFVSVEVHYFDDDVFQTDWNQDILNDAALNVNLDDLWDRFHEEILSDD